VTLSGMKTALTIVAVGLLLDACSQITVTGHASAGPGTGPSTGSTTSRAASPTGKSTTNSASTSGSTGGSTGGPTSASSTGRAGGSSTTSGTSGTTGGLRLDAGACEVGPGSNLQSEQGYFPGFGTDEIGNSADLNGDGLLDLVVVWAGTPGTSSLTVLFGLPDGGLSPPTSYPDAVLNLPSPIVVADVNGDGQPDVLCVRSGPTGRWWDGSLQIFLNVGGALELQAAQIEAASVAALAVGDLNQDGIADIVAGETTASGYVVNVFLGDGDGGFSAAVPVATLPQPYQVAFLATLFLSDVNQDGFPDIVAAAYGSSQLGVLLHEPDGAYSTMLYSFPGPVIVASLPRQGAAPDIVAAYGQSVDSADNGTVQILTNAGNGVFSEGSSYGVPNSANALVVSDFNGDCIPDVVVSANGCYQGDGAGLSVLLGNPDGGFGPAQSLPSPLGGPGLLTTLGPVSSPRALATGVSCGSTTDGGSGNSLVVFGDASRHQN